MREPAISGDRYSHAGVNHSHGVLLPAVLDLITELERFDTLGGHRRRRLFELGCGNGSVAHALTERGWDVTGVDPSAERIAQAQTAYPHLNLQTL